MLNLLNKGTSIPSPTNLEPGFKSDFEIFCKDVNPQFLIYDIIN
jgi:hypothetical protein